MVYTNKWKLAEEAHHEPMETLLPRLINELGSVKAAAQRLDIRPETAWKWGKRINLCCEYKTACADTREAQAAGK